MSFPGFSMGPLGPVRIGGSHSDFNLFTYMGSPGALAPGIIRVVLEADFKALETLQPAGSIVETQADSSTWYGAFRTGAWPSGTRIELTVMAGAFIGGDPGNGRNGGMEAAGGDAFGGGGGGAGGDPAGGGGSGGTAFAPAAAGSAGTATAAGAGGLGGDPSTGPLTLGDSPADWASHGLIVDDGVTLDLYNYGTIRGAGGGGRSGQPALTRNGLDGLEIHESASAANSFELGSANLGSSGGWVFYNSASATLNKLAGTSYPNVWGWEFDANLGNALAPRGKVADPPEKP